jgi:hypothetical protein
VEWSGAGWKGGESGRARGRTVPVFGRRGEAGCLAALSGFMALAPFCRQNLFWILTALHPFSAAWPTVQDEER